MEGGVAAVAYEISLGARDLAASVDAGSNLITKELTFRTAAAAGKIPISGV